MKKLLLVPAALFFAAEISAQCITIACPSNISSSNDAGQCGAVATFATPTASSTCVGALTDTFFYTGAQQTFVVPAGVNILTVETWGAQGGANWVNNVNYGGYVKGDIPVTPGETLYIYVGEQPTTITGGYNGGGNGEGAGKGGGGGTDVRQGGTALANRVVIAGGGGGAGYWSSLHVVGGVGGGLVGGDGYRDPNYATNPGGKGGTQTGGGADGTCVSFNNTICAGSLGQGGAPSGCGCEGYGGGGGYYGGAGSGNCRGGGGGSGYLIPSAINTNMLSGVRVGNGMVVITVQGSSNPTVTQTAGLASGSLFPIGTTTNTFTATDIFGNSASCSFDVTVTDNEAPVISGLPSAISVSNDAGQCGAVVSWQAPVVTENCTYTLASINNSGDFFPVGSTLVTYTATDPSLNSATYSFSVTVTDNEAPTITSCPSSVIVNNDPGQCVATNVVIGSPTSTDNCSVATTTSDAPGTYQLGTNTITWTVTDVNGNSATCSQVVTVVDAEPPVLSSCPADIMMCPGVVQFSDPTATDNCGTPVVSQLTGPASGNTLLPGNYTVSFMADDGNGNSDTCSFNITVNPNPTVTLALTTPSTVCFDDADYTLAGGSPVGGTWSGNGVTGSSFDPSSAGNGTQTITYNYVDPNGCMGGATDNIIVSQCVGISENGDISFNLFPNPATTYFTFESNGKGVLEIFSVSGQLVLTQQITSDKQQIGLDGLANGNYSVRYTSEGNVASGKLTIQK